MLINFSVYGSTKCLHFLQAEIIPLIYLRKVQCRDDNNLPVSYQARIKGVFNPDVNNYIDSTGLKPASIHPKCSFYVPAAHHQLYFKQSCQRHICAENAQTGRNLPSYFWLRVRFLFPRIRNNSNLRPLKCITCYKRLSITCDLHIGFPIMT